ncbi:Poly(A) polymerase central domain-containing protein [Chytriomyces sp. MP71]|nr:Poly(A) polymerase central domain-containing protein [Chytriomyces sp. MP71]
MTSSKAPLFPPSRSYPGVVPPLSLQGPAAQDAEDTQQLERMLVDHGHCDDAAALARREVAVDKIRRLFRLFVGDNDNGGGAVRTFGSVAIGVASRDSDVDALCIGPRFISRDRFFKAFANTLKSAPGVSSLSTITEAFVPVISFDVDGIEMDIVYARLNMDHIPEDIDLSDDALLANLDERCIRSLNGRRVADEVLQLVPNVAAFRTTLRCIKLWAKSRGIYSNILGYLGGVAWAISVAKVCQLYPNAAPNVLVTKFFNIMLHWDWPKPVILKPIHSDPWNPAVAPHLPIPMPIVTPAYPCMCATHNMTQSTFSITMHELKRAAVVTEMVAMGEAGWEDLVEVEEVLKGGSGDGQFGAFLAVIASSDSEERHFVWSGWVESRLRALTKRLEQIPGIRLVRAHTTSFDRLTPCKTEDEVAAACAGAPPPPVVYIDPICIVYTSTFYIALGFGVRVEGGCDVGGAVAEFLGIVRGGSAFRPESTGIIVKHLKANEIPAEHSSSHTLYRKRRKTLEKKNLNMHESSISNPQYAVHGHLSYAKEGGDIRKSSGTSSSGDTIHAESMNGSTGDDTSASVPHSGMLFVGGLDVTMTEFRLKKFFEKYGEITKLDYHWHKTGPKAGQPKGSAFIKFSSEASGVAAINALHGTVPTWNGTRKLTVAWSKIASQTSSSTSSPSDFFSARNNTVVDPPPKRPKTKREFEARALEASINPRVQKHPAASVNNDSRIASIERKLREMEGAELSSQVEVSAVEAEARKGKGHVLPPKPAFVHRAWQAAPVVQPSPSVVVIADASSGFVLNNGDGPEELRRQPLTLDEEMARLKREIEERKRRLPLANS